MNGAGLLGYARFQARDALPRALAPLALFVGLGGIPLWTMTRQLGLAASRENERFAVMSEQAYLQVGGMAMTLGAIVMMSGLASLDRERGHFRFLFAQPVAPWRYYLQHFVVSALLFVGCYAIIPLGFGAIFHAVPLAPALLSAGLYVLLYGALGLLCTAIWNRDGIPFILVLVVARTLQQVARTELLPGWLEGVAHALPPLEAADRVRTAWMAERALEGNDLVLVLGYALGMLASALLLIRAKPLAR